MTLNSIALPLFLVLGLMALLPACREPTPEESTTMPANSNQVTDAPDETAGASRACMLVEEGFGPSGVDEVQVEEVVDGLEVPWGLTFLPGGGLLVTERAGRIRLVQNGTLVPEPVATVATSATGEGGLLGIAAHPDMAENRFFYVYYATDQGGTTVNQVERWRLAEDGRSASADRVIVGGIPAARFHNGGRLRFGPDDLLYIGTGDARNPDYAQDTGSLAGKLLRVTPEGEVPDGNPFPRSPIFLTGIRNTQGFDWPDASTLWLTDHGPTGEMGRQGHDEVNVATPGANLGWPTIYGCEEAPDLVTPALTWEEAVPPGGAAIYRGDAFPDWTGNLLIGTLGSEHLHRVVFDAAGNSVQRHAVHLRGDQPDGYGRLREVMMGPDGHLYLTTSNCDGRGNCPPGRDKILRITG